MRIVWLFLFLIIGCYSARIIIKPINIDKKDNFKNKWSLISIAKPDSEIIVIEYKNELNQKGCDTGLILWECSNSYKLVNPDSTIDILKYNLTTFKKRKEKWQQK